MSELTNQDVKDIAREVRRTTSGGDGSNLYLEAKNLYRIPTWLAAWNGAVKGAISGATLAVAGGGVAAVVASGDMEQAPGYVRDHRDPFVVGMVVSVAVGAVLGAIKGVANAQIHNEFAELAREEWVKSNHNGR